MAQIPDENPGYTLLYSHRGYQNPLMQNWQSAEVYPRNGITIGPIKDKDTYAWQIDDDSPTKHFVYHQYLSTAETKQAIEVGWRLELRARIVDYPDPPPNEDAAEDASPFVLFRSGTRSFQLHFSTDKDGLPSIFMMRELRAGGRSGFSIPLTGYLHDYFYLKLDYSPDTKRVTIYLDDTPIYSGYTGARFESEPVIMWGAGSTTATGHANFNYLAFRVVKSKNQ